MSYGTLISTVTVGAGGSSPIVFSSIPQTYTDLLLVCSLRLGAQTTGNLLFNINGDFGSAVQSMRLLNGDGASATSTNASGATYFSSNIGKVPGTETTANTFGNLSIYMPNYAGSTNKSISVDNVTENNGTTAYQSLSAGLRADVGAITSLQILAFGGNFTQYSTASLYGITKGTLAGVTVA